MKTFSDKMRCPKCGQEAKGLEHYGITYEYSEEDNLISCMCARCHYEWNVLPIDTDSSDNYENTDPFSTH
jgi:C4-type Zn-finger protein